MRSRRVSERKRVRRKRNGKGDKEAKEMRIIREGIEALANRKKKIFGKVRKEKQKGNA